MKKINILIIEDKNEEIKSWETSIKQFNALAAKEGHKYIFYAEYAKSFSEAEGKLETFSFSAAVVDIRLEEEGYASNHENIDGLRVIKSIMNRKKAIVAIYTGQEKDAESDIDIRHKKFIKVFGRDSKTKNQLLTWFVVEQLQILESILHVKEQFNYTMSNLFYDSIWPRWEQWVGKEEVNIDDMNASLIRHMATHLHASYLNKVTNVHPEEYYFVPPLKQSWDTGDITVFEDKHYILVTPRCEIANKKNNTFQFVELKSVAVELEKIDQKIKDKNDELLKVNDDKEKIEKIEKAIAKEESKKRNMFSHGGNKSSLHFLPKIKKDIGNSYGPFYAQFDHMIFIKKDDQEKLTSFSDHKYASLSNEFIPSLVQRLGSYFNRIGSPDYSHY